MTEDGEEKIQQIRRNYRRNAELSLVQNVSTTYLTTAHFVYLANTCVNLTEYSQNYTG